jgi:hypothetical protein
MTNRHASAPNLTGQSKIRSCSLTSAGCGWLNSTRTSGYCWFVALDARKSITRYAPQGSTSIAEGEVRIVRQLVGLLPERVDLFERNASVGILKRNGIELCGPQNLCCVEAETRACVDHGPAGHAEGCAAHGADIIR